ncbi:MAG: hypothetical protein M1830_003531 [Pleopsidium flavum]|nr:MAG: hypothetical protein M1830_003531 [Pleopsidium flavum]
MSSGHVPEPKNFEPKQPVKLDLPKNDPISLEQLSKCDGTDPAHPTYVAIKGRVFDVSGNAAYGSKGQYHGMVSRLFNSRTEKED